MKAYAMTTQGYVLIADTLLADPGIGPWKLASRCGYSPRVMEEILASEEFGQVLEKRRAELIDPVLRVTVEERLKELVQKSVEVVMEKLEKPEVKGEFALRSLEVGAKAAGYGPRSMVAISQQFVVEVPAKAVNSLEWERKHSERALTVTVENDPKEI
jgi:hypothetical protein